MMNRHLRNALCIITAGLLMFGCAGSGKISGFKTVDLSEGFRSGELTQKVDNVAVIVDASDSMRGSFDGQKKIDYEIMLVEAMFDTIPMDNYQVVLRSFGQRGSAFKKGSILLYGMDRYSRDEVFDSLEDAKQTGWTSQMDRAIEECSDDIASVKGRTAVMIFSDGKTEKSLPLEAAEELVEKYGEKVCIYPIVIGDNSSGTELMEELAGVSSCGACLKGESIASPGGMAAFVKMALFEKGAPTDSDGDGVADYLDRCPDTPAGIDVDADGCPHDSDGDGVPDYLDRCPKTSPGVIVDDSGCALPDPEGAEVTAKGTWIFRDILFATGKWDVSPGLYPILDEVVGIMKENPNMKMEIQGHTDNVGSGKFNMHLSAMRAKAVMSYMLDKGITPDRLSYRGYGFTDPLVSNDTAEGRTLNRRVEFVPVR